MTKLKICGLRRMEDIEIINKYRPDFAGFVFAKSPRRVTAQEAKKMIGNLDSAIIPVGVFVNHAVESIAEIASCCGLRIIQLHGDEDLQYIHQIKKAVDCIIWKAFRIKDGFSAAEMQGYDTDGYLTDTFTSKEYGGSGKTFRWDLLEGIPKHRLILAGGLTPDNILEAIDKVHPFAVDLNSGVETNGFKDENKIELLVKRLKGAN